MRVDRGKLHHITHEITPSSNLKTIALTKSMYTEIHSYVEHAFDNMSAESGKKNVINQKSLRTAPILGMVEQAKKHGGFRPQRSYLGYALRPHRV